MSLARFWDKKMQYVPLEVPVDRYTPDVRRHGIAECEQLGRIRAMQAGRRLVDLRQQHVGRQVGMRPVGVILAAEGVEAALLCE